MIKTDRVIVVEGKYDKIKLQSVIDAVILPTGGFSIYRDKEKQLLLRTLAQKKGLAVLTDSDSAGFQIRGFLRNICGSQNIVDVYIPDLLGKEKRKTHASKEGKLGVEGVPIEVVRQAFEKAGIGCTEVQEEEKPCPITKADFFELGLTGGQNSAAHRQVILKQLSLPQRMTTNSLITVLNALMTRDQFEELFGKGLLVK